MIPKMIDTHVPADGPAPIHIKTALSGCCCCFLKHTKLGEKSGAERIRVVGIGRGSKFDQNTLNVCLKFSNIKI